MEDSVLLNSADPSSRKGEQPKQQRARKVGSREEVFKGDCVRTSGGLTREDLVLNEKSGRICTKKEVERGRHLSELMRSRKPVLLNSEKQDAAEVDVVQALLNAGGLKPVVAEKRRGRKKKDEAEVETE